MLNQSVPLDVYTKGGTGFVAWIRHRRENLSAYRGIVSRPSGLMKEGSQVTASAPVHSLMYRRLRAAVVAVLILVSCILLVDYWTSLQQRLRERDVVKQIVPGPALRAELAALLKEDDYDIGDLDIENYDIEVSYARPRWECHVEGHQLKVSYRPPEMSLYFTLKQELGGGQGALGEFWHTFRGMPVRRYESLVKKDSESANQPPPPDLVPSADAATALALKKLDAEGVSVTGREKTVKSTDTFWIVEYRFPEGKKPPANDKSAKIVVITAAVYKKTGRALVF